MSSSGVGLVIIIIGFGLCISQWKSTSLCIVSLVDFGIITYPILMLYTSGIVSNIQLLHSRWQMHGVLAGALGKLLCITGITDYSVL